MVYPDCPISTDPGAAIVRDTVSAIISEAVSAAIADGRLPLIEPPAVHIERPRDPSHGDWATNVALVSAKAAGMPPREIAEVIAGELRARLAGVAEVVEIAGPGFINIRLARDVVADVVTRIREERETFGAGEPTGRRVQVEFVSANPVGPMHVGHGRWAALGDSIARILAFAGDEVEREFYVNDAGVQMEIFAASVSARYLELCGVEVEFPEDGYRGAYIVEIAREILEAEGRRWAAAPAAEREAHFKEQAYTAVLTHLQRVLHGMGVDFDVWFSERTLHVPDEDGVSAIERGIRRLHEAGYVYEQDGAVWFRSTEFGDDKDRVLRKADGSYTYFAADVAYHADKYDRGFDLVIDIWGADHHGYVKRMEAAVAALGHPGKLEVIIGQLVNLFRNGEVVRMSKRTGEMVTFEDLLDEVGADAARYFFLRRSTDQPVDFDIALAKERSSDNPVYYVQYAHARICSLLRKASGADTADESVDVAAVAEGITAGAAELALLGSQPGAPAGEAELGLLRKLAEFPEVVEAAARQRAPHKLATYAEELAAAFHGFYTHCQVVVDDPPLRNARLALADASRIVLARALGLLGVTAPERM
jgi:arginyl-tRNA synthetase